MNRFAIYLNVKSSTWNQGIFTYFFLAFLLRSLSVKELSRKEKKVDLRRIHATKI